MMAVELASEAQVSRVIQSLLEKGVIGFYFLSCRNAFRLAPPLCITLDQIDFACDCIAEALDALD
jgi:4-aminobutyrate aminotransferase-like enzyme